MRIGIGIGVPRTPNNAATADPPPVSHGYIVVDESGFIQVNASGFIQVT